MGSSKGATSQNEIHLNTDSSANIAGVEFPINRKKAASTLRTYGGGGGVTKKAFNHHHYQFAISESPENAFEESMQKRKEAAFIAANQSVKSNVNTRNNK